MSTSVTLICWCFRKNVVSRSSKSIGSYGRSLNRQWEAWLPCNRIRSISRSPNFKDVAGSGSIGKGVYRQDTQAAEPNRKLHDLPPNLSTKAGVSVLRVTFIGVNYPMLNRAGPSCHSRPCSFRFDVHLVHQTGWPDCMRTSVEPQRRKR